MSFKSVSVAADGKFSPFLWLSRFPLYVYTTSSLAICPDGHLRCINITAVVNNVALNIGTRAFFSNYSFVWIYIYTHIHSEVELLGHMVVLILVWETSKLFSTVAVPVCIPINRVQEKERKKKKICKFWSSSVTIVRQLKFLFPNHEIRFGESSMKKISMENLPKWWHFDDLKWKSDLV